MKKGISLIILVITIVVILIIAGAVILSLSQNNPINSASEATYKASLNEYNSELTLYLANNYTLDATFNPNTVYATTWDGVSSITGTVKQYITNISTTDASDYIIEQGTLKYIGTDTNKKQWASSLGYKDQVVKSGLMFWVDGNDFKNNPQTISWKDRSGRNNNLTPTNLAYTNTSGSDGKGTVAFDGVFDCAYTNQSYDFINDFRSNEFTLEAKIVKGTNIIVGEVNTYGETIFASSVPSPYYSWLVIKNGEVGINAFGSTSATFRYTTGANILEGGTYYIQVVAKGGAPSKILVNGVVKGNITPENSVISSIGYFTLGDLRNGRNINFSGNIYFVRMYNRALTDAELTTNYNLNK